MYCKDTGFPAQAFGIKPYGTVLNRLAWPKGRRAGAKGRSP